MDLDLDALRKQVDDTNHEIVSLLAKRLKICQDIAKVKKENDLPILDEGRESVIAKRLETLALEYGLEPHLIQKLFAIFIEYTRDEMKKVQND